MTTSKRFVRVGAAALLLLMPLTSWAWSEVGFGWWIPILHPQSTRIGNSASAYGASYQYNLRFDRDATRHLQDVFIRTGTEFVPGSWTVEVCGAAGCTAPLANVTVSLQPHAWNQITFNPPVEIPNSTSWGDTPFNVVFSPVGAAEIEFVSLGEGGGLPRDLRVGMDAPSTGSPRYLAVEAPIAPSAPQLTGRGVIVVTWAGLTDPWAPAACPGAILAEGNPYFELRSIQVSANEAVSQSFIPVPQSGTTERLYYPHIVTSPASAAQLEFQNPSGVVVQVAPSVEVNTCFLLEHAAPDPLHTVTTVPTTSGFTVYGLSANPTPLNACDPIARATWGGSRGAASIGGIVDPALDLGLSWNSLRAIAAYEDADRDGFGGAFDACGLPGSTTTPGDCDDQDPGAYPGAPERCNGWDDDCDGVVDAADPDLVTETCEMQYGVCASARHVAAQCINGAWEPCGASEYGALYEEVERACDGKDNDCDGEIDEALPLDAPCILQKGVCAGSRAAACVNGAWAQCTSDQYGPDYEAQETRCDGFDNDCDGFIDGEDPDLPRPPCELSGGVCAGTLKPGVRCGAQGWGACQPEDYGPRYEVTESRCDELDNDCDGTIDWRDSDFREIPCEKQEGVCAGKVLGWWQCHPDGGWESCGAAEYGPDFEADETSCDGLDNDCDGVTDEGCDAGAPPERPSRPAPASGCSAAFGASTWPYLMLLVAAFISGRKQRWARNTR